MNMKNNSTVGSNPADIKKVLDTLVLLKHKEKAEQESEAPKTNEVDLEAIVQKVVKKRSSKSK